MELHYHPLASYCWKVLIALYEGGIAFEPRIVDLGDAQSRAAFLKLAPLGKMPVLRDGDRTVHEFTIIIEYLALSCPGAAGLVPADARQALEVRGLDRFFDLYVHEPMQKIVGDRLRAPGQGDPRGVELARASLATAYSLIDRELAGRVWAAGSAFSLADCAAAPALYYARKVASWSDSCANLAGYHQRLMQQPSVARVIEEAGPYFTMFPARPGDR